MADIAKCKGDGCPLKENCYRHQAKSNEFWQSYFAIVPYDEKRGTCDHYWRMFDQRKGSNG